MDSHTAEKLVSECLAGPLMKDRTIVLITHHVDLIISRCAYVVQVEEGTIVAQGTPDELREQGVLAAIRETAAKEEKVIGPVGDELAEQTQAEADGKTKPARKLVEKEEKAEGRVKLGIYHLYLKAASYSLMAIAVVLIIGRFSGNMSQKFWIRCEPVLCHCLTSRNRSSTPDGQQSGAKLMMRTIRFVSVFLVPKTMFGHI